MLEKFIRVEKLEDDQSRKIENEEASISSNPDRKIIPKERNRPREKAGHKSAPNVFNNFKYCWF
jgi:hypothetical protein